MSVVNISKMKVLKNSKVEQGKTPSKYYVYLATDKDGNVVYVGKGSGWRYLHINSGTSGTYELNRQHFLGESFTVRLVRSGMTEEVSLEVEAEIISMFSPKYNKMSSGNRSKTKSRQFKVIKGEGVQHYFSLGERVSPSITNSTRHWSDKPRVVTVLGMVVHNLLQQHKIHYSNNKSRQVNRQFNPKRIFNDDIVAAIQILEYHGYLTNTVVEREAGMPVKCCWVEATQMLLDKFLKEVVE